MHCYRHREDDAVALCQNCGKAACPDCCEDKGQGIACCWTCAEELQQTRRLNERLAQSVGIGSQPPMPASVPTYFFFGLILLVTGTYLSFDRPGIDFLTLAMAAAFFVMAGVTYKRFRNSCPTC